MATILQQGKMTEKVLTGHVFHQWSVAMDTWIRLFQGTIITNFWKYGSGDNNNKWGLAVNFSKI